MYKIEDFKFPVEEKELEIGGNPTNLIAVYKENETDFKNWLGFHTNDYNVLQNSELINVAEETFESLGVKAFCDCSQSLLTDRRMKLVYKTDQKFEVGDKGDKHSLMFILNNSYDGSLMYSAQVGVFHLICSNGAMIGERWSQIRNKHVIKFDKQIIIEQIEKGIESVPMLKELHEQMLEYKLTAEVIRKTLELSYKMNLIGKVDVTDLIEGNQSDLTMFAFLNTITFFTTHIMKSRERAFKFNSFVHDKMLRRLE